MFHNQQIVNKILPCVGSQSFVLKCRPPIGKVKESILYAKGQYSILVIKLLTVNYPPYLKNFSYWTKQNQQNVGLSGSGSPI